MSFALVVSLIVLLTVAIYSLSYVDVSIETSEFALSGALIALFLISSNYLFALTGVVFFVIALYRSLIKTNV